MFTERRTIVNKSSGRWFTVERTRRHEREARRRQPSKPTGPKTEEGSGRGQAQLMHHGPALADVSEVSLWHDQASHGSGSSMIVPFPSLSKTPHRLAVSPDGNGFEEISSTARSHGPGRPGWLPTPVYPAREAQYDPAKPKASRPVRPSDIHHCGPASGRLSGIETENRTDAIRLLPVKARRRARSTEAACQAVLCVASSRRISGNRTVGTVITA